MGADFVAMKDPAAAKQEPDLDTRERLVRAAIEVFLEKGYGGTRVQDIARRAGFTSGALYVHFPSRTALLGEAIIREGQTIMAALTEKIGNTSEGHAAAADLLAELSSGEPTSLDLLLLEALALASRSDEAKQVLATALDGFVDVLMKRINDARDNGDLDESIDTEALRQVFVSWIFGGVVVKALRIRTAPVDALSAATQRLFGGLKPTA